MFVLTVRVINPPHGKGQATSFLLKHFVYKITVNSVLLNDVIDSTPYVDK